MSASSRNAFERELASLNAVRVDPAAPGAAETLRRALAARSNLLVARAAEIVAEWELARYEAELVAAFDRFLPDAIRRDPTCAAKIAIVEALNRLESREVDLFRAGARHTQMEPVWGGREDTAARLRAACGLGLARCDPPDVLLELARLLIDDETDARLGAVRAIAYATRPGGAPLLWYKAHLGDAEPTVRLECFAALLALIPEQALALVGERARGADPVEAEAALAALGGSRLPDALPELAAAWEQSNDPAIRRAALIAMAGLDDDASFAWLLDLLEKGSARDAADANAALARFHDDERRSRRIAKVLRRRGDAGPAAA